MDADAFTPIGRISKTHGLRGEVSVITTVDLPLESLVGVEAWFVPPPATVRSARIAAVRPGPKGPLLTLEGVTDITVAGSLRGSTLLVRAAEIPEQEPELDPIGFTVLDEQRGEIGVVQDVIETGANDVWVVQGRFGEVLVPVIDDVIEDIDEDAEVVHVRLLPGLIEER